jgi:hypothetical protein
MTDTRETRLHEMTPDQLQWVVDHNMQIRAGHRVQICKAVEACRAAESARETLQQVAEILNCHPDESVVDRAKYVFAVFATSPESLKRKVTASLTASRPTGETK